MNCSCNYYAGCHINGCMALAQAQYSPALNVSNYYAILQSSLLNQVNQFNRVNADSVPYAFWLGKDGTP